MEMVPLGCEAVRRVDRIAVEQYGMSGLVLMENAGRGAAEIIDREAPPGEIAILCGRGNNGGDGFVAARHLELLGRAVRLVVMGDPERMSDDARVNHRIAVAAGMRIEVALEPSEAWIAERMRGCTGIVDAMLGTGTHGDPRPPMDIAVREANAVEAMRFALDLPTGLDADTGLPGTPCFRADHTCSFVAPKIGFAEKSAEPYIGRVHVVGIGVPRRLLDELVGRGSG